MENFNENGLSIWIIVRCLTRDFKECVIAPAQSTIAFSKITSITQLRDPQTVTLTMKIYRMQPTNKHEGYTLKETSYLRQTPTEYSRA